ncbi:hypothetical protein HF521_019854 [Silurus meridionalis]|uniref:Uncharacterized protein n=1 Tax=Silurus meridionalis TaxID=175797 RepID=A0A8T0BMJ9_SILME|nr:hypothetical protein HF521_019854 [Silurus meridionalis]
MGGVLGFLLFSNKTESSPVAGTSPNPEKEKCDPLCIPDDNTAGDISRTGSIFQPSKTSDHLEDVDKINIHVINSGRSVEIMIFPLEKISYLLQHACEHFHKKPECMKLIFEGEQLDLTMMVNHYPKLRGGSKVNLIHAS